MVRRREPHGPLTNSQIDFSALDSFRMRAGQNAKVIPILGHRPACDLDAIRLQQVDDRLIGQRPLRVLPPTRFPILSFTPRALMSSPLVVESPEEKKNLRGCTRAGSDRTSRS